MMLLLPKVSRPLLTLGATLLAMAAGHLPLHNTRLRILHLDDGLRQYSFWIAPLRRMLGACWQPLMVKSNENKWTIIQFRA
jgi:hypothetical protein